MSATHKDEITHHSWPIAIHKWYQH